MILETLLEHLENLKVYTDFKESGVSNIIEFWNRIDKGRSIKNLSDKQIDFSEGHEEPSEEALKHTIDRKEWVANRDLIELYHSAVKENIIYSLEKDRVSLPELFELKRDFKGLIRDNYNLNKYLHTTDDIVEEYLELSEENHPDSFFWQFHPKQRNLPKPPLSLASSSPKKVVKKKNPHPEIFTDDGYRLFKLLMEVFPKKDSDFAYILWKLKADKFIHNSISESDFKRFLDSKGVVTGRLKPLHTIANKLRDPIYNSTLSRLKP